MATLVCFHAHPDDEAISTGGLMAKASAAGHRVVLVTATRGEQGEPVEGVLAPGEELWQRRIVELAESARLLGAEEPRLLGYEDSGMMGEASNDNPACFWQAPLVEAAERLAKILSEVQATVLTIYDNHGGYGHPDHIQVHRVGLAAAELAGVEYVYEATINREAAQQLMSQAADDPSMGDTPDAAMLETFGTPEADISFVLDVTGQIKAKRAALRAHASQIDSDSFFLSLPDEVFALAFGQESFNSPGVTGTGGPASVDMLPGL